MADLSPEAQERARLTVQVAAVFGAYADRIARDVLDLPDGHVLVAVVDGGHEFLGTHHVDKAEMVARIPELEGPGGWAMVFSPGADAEHVRRRAGEMAAIAQQRIETIERIRARRNL